MAGGAQLENGFSRIANELLDAISGQDMPSACLRVWLWIARNSYGWQRKATAPASAWAISRALNMPHTTAKRSMRYLLNSMMINRSDSGALSIQKDPEKWSGQEPESKPTHGPIEYQDKPIHGPIISPLMALHKPIDGLKQAHQWPAIKALKKERKIKKTTSGPKISPPIVRVVEAYKVARGIKKDDAAWDRANFARNAKAAKSLLDRFAGDVDKVAVYVFGRSEHLAGLGLEWTLETIARHAWDNAGMKQELPEDQENGYRNMPLGHDRGIEPPRRASYTQARNLAGDTLRAIECSQDRQNKPGNVGSDGDNRETEPGF